VTPRKPNLSRQPTNPSASNSGHAAGDENARRRDRKLSVAIIRKPRRKRHEAQSAA